MYDDADKRQHFGEFLSFIQLTTTNTTRVCTADRFASWCVRSASGSKHRNSRRSAINRFVHISSNGARFQFSFFVGVFECKCFNAVRYFIGITRGVSAWWLVCCRFARWCASRTAQAYQGSLFTLFVLFDWSILGFIMLTKIGGAICVGESRAVRCWWCADSTYRIAQTCSGF